MRRFSSSQKTQRHLVLVFVVVFLGMFHMEIIQERLEREYDIDLITTAPTVIYEIACTKDEVLSKLITRLTYQHLNDIVEIREPIVEAIY